MRYPPKYGLTLEWFMYTEDTSLLFRYTRGVNDLDPLRAIVSNDRSTSLSHIGKLMQTKEVVALLGMRRLSSHCGWIIYTIQVFAPYGAIAFTFQFHQPRLELPG
jgi:hypothetical protein